MSVIRKGDTVYVRTGADRGRTGRVLWVNPKKGQVLVEGVNMRKKHQRPTQKNPKGGVVTIESPVALSNVSLFVTIDGKPVPTRVKAKTVDEGGKKMRVRVARLTGEQI